MPTPLNSMPYSGQLITLVRESSSVIPIAMLNKGAEMLKINLRGRFEVQIVDGEVNPAYEMGLEVNYRLPRFYPHFYFHRRKRVCQKQTSPPDTIFQPTGSLPVEFLVYQLWIPLEQDGPNQSFV